MISDERDEYEDAVVRIAVEMARERGRGDRSFYRYRPEEIMKLVAILRAEGELWDDGWKAHSALERRPLIRTGYTIRRVGDG